MSAGPPRVTPRAAVAGRGCGGQRPGESGVVTVELAFGMVAFALFLVLTVTALATGVDHLRCAEASRVGARLAARAEPAGAVVDAALATAPAGSRVRISGGADLVVVTVTAPERGIFARLGIDVAAVGRSVAPREVR